MYRLKDDVKFNAVNRISIKEFEFDLKPYYNEKTRIIETPERYIEFSCMGQVFVDFLIPADLVERIE